METTMREIVLDTETTGLDPLGGHKIVEIGCVELINHMPTENTFHHYVNPQRDMPDGAFAVHGLSEEFLSGHGLFADIVDKFLDYINDAPLIIHNASFDMGFLNAELKALKYPPLDMSRAIDTVAMARRKFPGSRVNLDALCQRFDIDNSDRALHGALKDAHLLAGVYLELVGGRQPDLALKSEKRTATVAVDLSFREPRPYVISDKEIQAHKDFVATLKDPLWNK